MSDAISNSDLPGEPPDGQPVAPAPSVTVDADTAAMPSVAAGTVRRRSGKDVAAAAMQNKSANGMLAGARWLALLVIGALSLWPMAHKTVSEFNEYMLTRADDNQARELLVQGLRNPGGADQMEIISELAIDLAGPDTAETAARAALAADPSRTFVWARLSWLLAERSGRLNNEAQDALVRSMDTCLLCDEELIRWRFNFVLAHWGDASDLLRRRAFEQADILRWRGENAAFLAEMRVKALRAGIPFDAYRANVDTPVRSWDLGPVESSVAAPV